MLHLDNFIFEEASTEFHPYFKFFNFSLLDFSGDPKGCYGKELKINKSRRDCFQVATAFASLIGAYMCRLSFMDGWPTIFYLFGTFFESRSWRPIG